MRQLSIGAVERLTQIPAHTLRKWESRHGIAEPVRTPTGRRVYTDEHVDMLKLVKLLVGNGHALAHLAELGLGELRELAERHRETPEPASAEALILVGPNVGRLLPNNPTVRERFAGPLDAWCEQASPDPAGTLVVEADTIPPETVAQLAELKGQMKDVLVIYRFAARSVVNDLRAQQLMLVQGPADDETILAYLAPEPVLLERAAHRFSPSELARIASMKPGLECECPNHIAKLLMDIGAFERYSEECVDTDPAERALHQRLSAISAQARGLFEDALIAVATADGIELTIERETVRSNS